jgi:hypothetical protein
MSLNVLANHMATKGRGSDSMLVHMTPAEVASLQALAMKNGGSLTINPETGLPEAGFLKKLLPMIAGFALGPAGFGLMSAAGAGLTVGAVTGLATGSLSKGLMAGLGAYGGAGLGEAFMGAGANVGAGAGANLATSLTDAQAQALGFQNAATAPAANAAATSSFDKIGAGFKAVTDSPSALGQFAKDNWKMGLAAASPFIADAMVPTTVKAPNAQSTGYIRPFQFDENTRTVRAMDPVLASEWGARQFPDYIRKGQPSPPAGMGAQLPPGMARGGIVALAGGGIGDQEVAPRAPNDGIVDETGFVMPRFEEPAVPQMQGGDPYARFNTLSGQSKDAYDYLMGNIQRVPAADLTTPTRPIVSNTNTVSTTGGGGDGGGGTGPVEPPATFFPPTHTEPVMPSPDEDFPSTYPEPVPADPRDFGAVDEPVTFAPADPRDFGAVDEPVIFAPANPRDFGAVDPEPDYEPVDASYWSNPGQDEVGPSRGLRKNQEELPEEFDKYLKKDDDELGYLTGNRPELTPEPAQDTDPNFFEPGYGNTGTPEPTEYEVQPWENVNNPEIGTAPPSREGLPDAFGSYPGESTYIGPTEVIGGGGGGGSAIEVDGDVGSGDEDYYDYQGMARGGLTQRYADGGVSGSGSLDLHVPINIGAGGGGMGGGFNGGYTPAGSNGSAGNMNPNTGGGLSGIAGLFGGQPQAQPYQPYQPHHYGLEPMTQPVNPPQMHSQPHHPDLGFIQQLFNPEPMDRQMDKPTPDWSRLHLDNPQQYEHVMQPRQFAQQDYLGAIPNTNHGIGMGGANLFLAGGGMVPGYALGGLGALGGYSDGGRLLKGPGDGVSDSIPATIGNKKQPARLADGEFVVPARIVSELGNGSTEAGARKLYAMMDRIQKARGKTVGKGKVAANSRSDKHLPA